MILTFPRHLYEAAGEKSAGAWGGAGRSVSTPSTRERLEEGEDETDRYSTISLNRRGSDDGVEDGATGSSGVYVMVTSFLFCALVGSTLCDCWEEIWLQLTFHRGSEEDITCHFPMKLGIAFSVDHASAQITRECTCQHQSGVLKVTSGRSLEDE